MEKVKIENMTLNIEKYGIDMLLTKNATELLFKFINALQLTEKCNDALLQRDINYVDLSIDNIPINVSKLCLTKPMLIDISSILNHINIETILNTSYIEEFDIITGISYSDINKINDIVDSSKCNVVTILNPRVKYDILTANILRYKSRNMYLYRDSSGLNKIIMYKDKDVDSPEEILIIEEFLESSVNKEDCYQVLLYNFNESERRYKQHIIYHNDNIRYTNRIFKYLIDNDISVLYPSSITFDTPILDSIEEHTDISYYRGDYDYDDKEFKSIEKTLQIPYKHTMDNYSIIQSIHHEAISKLLTGIDPSYVDGFNIGSYLRNTTSFTVDCNRKTSIESMIVFNEPCLYVDTKQPNCIHTGLTLNKSNEDIKNDLVRITRDMIEKAGLKGGEEYCIDQVQKIENAIITTVDIQCICHRHNILGENSNTSTYSKAVVVLIGYTIDGHEHELISYVADNINRSWYTNRYIVSSKTNDMPKIYSKQYGNGGKYVNGVFEADEKIFMYEPWLCLCIDNKKNSLDIYDVKKYLRYTVGNVDIDKIQEHLTDIASVVRFINNTSYDNKILLSEFTLKTEDDFIHGDA